MIVSLGALFYLPSYRRLYEDVSGSFQLFKSRRLLQTLFANVLVAQLQTVMIKLIDVLLDVGFTFGDPHLTTIDGAAYTFNGLGEYFALKSPGMFTLQARTKKATNDKGDQVDATIFSAFAAKDVQHDSPIVRAFIKGC